MKKFFKIGEISKLYGIGVDSIRYYEEIGIIKPKRSESGYRYYSIQDLWKLNVIRDLRSIGFTMEQIRQYLNHHTVSSSLSMLEDEKEAIAKQMQYLQKLQKNVEHRLSNIHSALSLPVGEIRFMNLPPRHCHRLPEGYKYEEEMDFLIKQLINLNQNRLYIIGSNQIGTIISLPSLLNKNILSYQSVFLIDEEGTDHIPGGDYLCVTYHGNYSQSAYWGQQLIDYAHAHNFVVSGNLLEILWIDIHTTSEESEYVTQLQLPVKSQESKNSPEPKS
jgi:DNA-binding transcriptional MerR regulator